MGSSCIFPEPLLLHVWSSPAQSFQSALLAHICLCYVYNINLQFGPGDLALFVRVHAFVNVGACGCTGRCESVHAGQGSGVAPQVCPLAWHFPSVLAKQQAPGICDSSGLGLLLDTASPGSFQGSAWCLHISKESPFPTEPSPQASHARS